MTTLSAPVKYSGCLICASGLHLKVEGLIIIAFGTINVHDWQIFIFLDKSLIEDFGFEFDFIDVFLIQLISIGTSLTLKKIDIRTRLKN